MKAKIQPGASWVLCFGGAAGMEGGEVKRRKALTSKNEWCILFLISPQRKRDVQMLQLRQVRYVLGWSSGSAGTPMPRLQ